MKRSSAEMDMLHGPLTGNLFRFAMPIALSSMLQQLFNAADTSVVGLFADSNALAAVGTNNEIVALLVTLASGLSIGVNVLIARAIGRGRREEISPAVHTSLVLSVLVGLSWLLVGLLCSKPLLRMIRVDSEILPDAVRYLRIYLLGYPFLLLYDFASAVLRAKGDSRRPFFALVLSGILNVLLNLFFVLVCGMGVAGVAWATDLSTAFSAALVLIWLRQEPDEFRFLPSRLTLNLSQAKEILRIGLPSALQGAVFCFANIFVQSSVNSYGKTETAGSTISINYEYFAYYVITAFAQAATTFIGQNYAAQQKDRCRMILQQCALFGFLLSAFLTTPLVIRRDFFAGFFTKDPAVIAAASRRILIILTLQSICAFYEAPAGALRGAGYSTLPAVITMVGSCCLRILWIFTVFARFRTQFSLFIIYPINWTVTAVGMNAALLLLHPFREDRQDA